jgi:hypothetical protein
MVKAWIAREWRNGKTEGAALDGTSSAVPGPGGLPDVPGGWSAEGWDENMLALCESMESSLALDSQSRCETDPTGSFLFQSRPTLASASPVRTSTRRTSTSSSSPSRSTIRTLRSPTVPTQPAPRSAGSPTAAWTSTLRWTRATFRARASSATLFTAAAAALATGPTLPAAAEAGCAGQRRNHTQGRLAGPSSPLGGAAGHREEARHDLMTRYPVGMELA